MKIAKVDVLEVHIRRPAWRLAFCRIYTDEGIYGSGEAVLAYGTAAPAAAGMVRDLATPIIGTDPLDNEAIWDKLYKPTSWGQNGGSAVFFGVSALDITLWDIKGKYLRVLIHELLGDKRRDNLCTYASQLQLGWGDACRDSVEMGMPHNMVAIADYVEDAKKAMAESYGCIRIDLSTFAPEGGHRYTDGDRTRLLPPGKVHTIEERVATVRRAIGPDVDIVMENYSHLNAQPAVQLGRAIQKYNIFYFKEPSVPNVRTTKFIRDELAMSVSHGERLYSRWQYVPFFEDQSAQAIQSDLGNCGGLTEGRRVYDMAHAYDISAQAHARVSPLSTAAALHPEVVTLNFVIHEHHTFSLHEYNRELCTASLQPANGRLKVPKGPGLGAEISPWTVGRPTKYTVE